MFKRFVVTMFLAAALVFAGGQNNQANAAQDFNFDDYNFIKLTTSDTFEAVVDSNIDFLTLRSGPSPKYRLITKIPPGARVTVTYTAADYEYMFEYVNPNFVAVTYRGIDGYASKKYLTILRHIGSRA